MLVSGAASQRLSPVLDAVAACNIFPDSKTIVDRPLRAAPETVAAAFAATFSDPNAAVYAAAVRAFVDQWFDPVGSDLIAPFCNDAAAALPPPPPGWLPGVSSPAAREWALHLHAMWAALCRAAAPGVRAHPNRHTLLPAPGPFIIPGARFREAYYWDSYWVVQGLLVSGLADLARSVVGNLLFCVESFGFVPNGLRSYYLNRSQPPLLAAMVEAVWEATGDVEFARRALPALQTELAWWRGAPRAVTVQGPGGGRHQLSRYCAAWSRPRPESHREDLATVRAFSPGDKESAYQHIASAAESGWDFSSRWFADGETLASIHTTTVVPADLNALLLRAERTAAALAAALGETEAAAELEACAAQRLLAIDAVHWDPAACRWRDRTLVDEPTETGAPTKLAAFQGECGGVVYASEFVPLWCGCAAPGSAKAAAAVAALRRSGLAAAGGVAASTRETGQQWDWPNAWPPLQSMLAEGCEACGGAEGKLMAEEIAKSFLRAAHGGWRRSGRMLEKFDARDPGAAGYGGEYACVDGFGWTNGLALVWLEKYGGELEL